MGIADIDLRRLEEVGLNGLQTQRQLFYDGWLLRISPGRAKRARSVNAFFGSSLPLAEKIPYCERVYEARGLPVLFRMTPFVAPPDLERTLVARGYQSFEKTLAQVLALDRPPEPQGATDCDVVAMAPREFVEAAGVFQEASVEQRAAHLERLANTPLANRGLVARNGERVVGCGQATIEDGLAGIFSVATARDLRGRGIATSIVAALLAWAWDHGARAAYLQVDENNYRALAVYRRFGFATAYTYHYLGRPGECR
jgi:ribosomal protein S18 acetylase RimI-like enzyme